MKKLLKRLLPAAMALSMIFSMSATALAADDLLPQDAAIPADALVLTEDTVITEDTDVMVVVAAPGIKVTVDGAKLAVGVIVVPWAHHEELECTTCHKAHRASVMYCTQCHAQAEVPEGWLSMAESNNLPGVKAAE